MTARSRLVIGAAVGVVALATAAVLAEMFGTILFAITVAYVLTPVQRWFLRRGWSRRWASVATTILSVLAVVVVVTPLAIVAFRRSAELAALVGEAPEEVAVQALGVEAVVARADVVDVIVSYLPAIVMDAAVFLSAMSIKLALFGIVVFGLLLGHEQARRAIVAPVPPAYRRFVAAMEDRARETLTALLVLQVGTALATFVLAVPFFWLLGYDYVVVLSTLAGVLQFLPLIGPIVLLLGIGALEVATGEIAAAAVVVVVGGLLIGWLPDLAVRPQLARYTAGMSGSLYFVGFIGGITSLGVIGVLAGPLLVALLVEGIEQLAAEMPHTEERPATAEAD